MHYSGIDRRQQVKKLVLIIGNVNGAWMEKPSLRHWLKRMLHNVFEAYCDVCKNWLQLGTIGLKALDLFGKSTKHLIYL